MSLRVEALPDEPAPSPSFTVQSCWPGTSVRKGSTGPAATGRARRRWTSPDAGDSSLRDQREPGYGHGAPSEGAPSPSGHRASAPTRCHARAVLQGARLRYTVYWKTYYARRLGDAPDALAPTAARRREIEAPHRYRGSWKRRERSGARVCGARVHPAHFRRPESRVRPAGGRDAARGCSAIG